MGKGSGENKGVPFYFPALSSLCLKCPEGGRVGGQGDSVTTIPLDWQHCRPAPVALPGKEFYIFFTSRMAALSPFPRKTRLLSPFPLAREHN